MEKSVLLGHSASWWDAAMLISLALAAVIAFIVAGATAGSVMANKREAAAARDDLDRYKSEAGKRIAEANAAAAASRLELAKYKSPRTLSQAQQDKISDALKSFAGTPYDIAIGPMGDPEPLYLARYIHQALSHAGWKTEDWPDNDMTYSDQGVPRLGVTMVTNVIVDVHPNHIAALGQAGAALAAALNANDVDAITDSKPTSPHLPRIHIRIGRKM